MEFSTLEFVQKGEYPILGNTRVLFNGKDITDSLFNIKVELSEDGVSIVNIELKAKIEGELKVIDEKELFSK
jgi:hypothetical protein